MTDARAMVEPASAPRWLAIGLLATAVAGGLWLAVGSSRDTSEGIGAGPATPPSGDGIVEIEPTRTQASKDTPEESITQPADYQIEKGGRLSLDATSFPADGAVTFRLALDKEALGGGQEPLSAVVVSAGDGRRLALSAVPVAGPPSSVRLEVDSSWLEPGLYMIQIRTAEKTPLPLRRYVLEVKGALAPPAPE